MDKTLEQRYFLTVDWCSKGKRGIFCSDVGKCFSKSEEPHTDEEMNYILGPFALILAPKSELFTMAQVKQYTQFLPLAEYSLEFGIALPGEGGAQ